MSVINKKPFIQKILEETTYGTYTLKVTITGGIPVFSWVA